MNLTLICLGLNVAILFFVSIIMPLKGMDPDIEKLPKFQSKSNWLKGIKNWLNLIEMHYGLKPIIYTSDGFYKHHLKTDPFFKTEIFTFII